MEQDISGFGTQGSSAPPITPTQGVQGTTGGTSGTAYTQSTIKESQIEAIIQMLLAELPILQAPLLTATSFNNPSQAPGVTALSVANAANEKTKNDIITSMWQSFDNAVREAEKRAKEEDFQKFIQRVQDRGGPQSAAEYAAYVMTLSASQKVSETDPSSALAVQFQGAFNRWFDPNMLTTNAIGDFGGSNGYPSTNFLAAAGVASAGAFRDAIGGVSLGLDVQVSTSPVADALLAVGPTTGLPGDYQAAGALVAALLNGGAMYKATVDTLQQAAGAGQPPQDLEFALNYAKNVMQIVTHNLEKDSQLPPDDFKQNRLIRSMLTLMALNMVYRSGYGGMTGEELANILAGDTADIHEDIKPTIDQLASFLRNFLPTDPLERQEAIVNMMAYVDGKNSVDSMLQTTHLLTSLLATGDIDYKRFQSQET